MGIYEQAKFCKLYLLVNTSAHSGFQGRSPIIPVGW